MDLPPPTGTPPPGKTPRCAFCGYELTGLQVQGCCPECNAEIWGSRNAPQSQGFAITSMVLGIVSLVTCSTGFICIITGPFALLTAIPGLIFGHLALNRKRHAGRGMAIAGLVMNWLVMGGFLLYMLFFVGMMVSSGGGNFAPAPGGGFTPAPAGP